MFKSRTPLMVAALLLVSLLTAQAAECPPQGASEWILVAPAGEGFSIRMPVKPEEETDRVPLMGNTYQMRLYTGVDEASGLIYMVAMQEFPSLAGSLKPAERLEQFMTGFKEGLAKSIGAAGVKLELMPERDLDLKGHLGRQYTLSLAESRGLVRAFDATTRMYILLVMGGDERNSSIGRFFDSFEITPAPAPVPKPIASN
ncbi:MAG: hypothetical protein ABR556_05775 [Pyrinomonadaceae bacterium]